MPPTSVGSKAQVKKKQDNPAVAVAVVVVALLVVGIANKDKIFKSKAAAKAGHPVGIGGGPGGGPGSSAIGGLSPQDIPTLSLEIVKKIKDKHGVDNFFTRAQIDGGTNPFLPRTIDPQEVDAQPEPVAGGGQTDESAAPAFTKQISYWGAFPTADAKKAIIQIQGEPNTWMGEPGEQVPSTPFIFTRFLRNDLAIELLKPAKGRERELRVQLGFAGDEKGPSTVVRKGGLAAGSQDAYKDLFGNNQGAGGPGVKVPASVARTAPGGPGNLEKAFEK